MKYLGVFCRWVLKKKLNKIFFFIFGKGSKRKKICYFFQEKITLKFRFWVPNLWSLPFFGAVLRCSFDKIILPYSEKSQLPQNEKKGEKILRKNFSAWKLFIWLDFEGRWDIWLLQRSILRWFWRDLEEDHHCFAL